MVLDDVAGPGWSGALRVERGRTVVEELCAGTVRPAGPACSATTRFQAGSISKLVVEAVVLALAERDELALHLPDAAVDLVILSNDDAPGVDPGLARLTSC